MARTEVGGMTGRTGDAGRGDGRREGRASRRAGRVEGSVAGDTLGGRTGRAKMAAAGGAAAIAAGGWAVQHRAVSRARAALEEAGAALQLPKDAEHHSIETSDGGRIHVVEKGSGRPIVLLHGVTLAASIWGMQFAALSGDFRVVALDQRGHGLSVPGRDGFGWPHEVLASPSGAGFDGKGEVGGNDSGPVGTPRSERPGSPATMRMAVDLDEVMGYLGIEGALLVGHSMGGMVALEYLTSIQARSAQGADAHTAADQAAGAHVAAGRDGGEARAGSKADRDHQEGTAVGAARERVSAVALVSTTAGPLLRLPGPARLSMPLESVAGRVLDMASKSNRHLLPEGDVSYWSARLAFGRSPDPAHVCMTEDLLRAMPPSWVGQLTALLVKFYVANRLERVTVPAAVVVGTSDILTPIWHARRLAERIPDAELHTLPHCGHMSMFERPDRLEEILRALAARAGA